MASECQRRAIETFLPVYETLRQWKNGRHRVSLPLFPGYAFVRIALKDRLSVLKVPGVVRLVGIDGTPTALDDQEVEGLRHAMALGLRAEPHPFLTVGRRVRITAGPLAGCAGILVRRKGNLGVVLSVHLIQRSVLVETDAASVEPLG